MTVQEIVDKYGSDREHLISILHDIQSGASDNSLHCSALQDLSRIIDVPLADIVGTASFYTMFSLTPRGRHIIRLCESPPCYIAGEENILDALEKRLGIKLGETTPDGLFTLEASSCLGACGVAPVMMVDDDMYGNLTEAKALEIIEAINAATSRMSECEGTR
jgi:NADH-quinone oxidoreductase subunit E